MPDLGRAALFAGNIIELHSASDSKQAAKGYLILAEILERRACQASFLEALLVCTL